MGAPDLARSFEWARRTGRLCAASETLIETLRRLHEYGAAGDPDGSGMLGDAVRVLCEAIAEADGPIPRSMDRGA